MAARSCSGSCSVQVSSGGTDSSGIWSGVSRNVRVRAIVSFPVKRTVRKETGRRLTLVPLRDRLQLERRTFKGPILLTLPDELVRCQVSERAVWAALIVVDAPRLDDRFRLG